MSSPNVDSIRESVHTAFWLAHLLEYMEHHGGAFDAQGYRNVVSRLQELLQGPLPEAALAAVLRRYRSAAEVFENLNYAHAGLSCASLECKVLSEVLAARLIQRVSQRPQHPH
jgi:hypothetical protein